MRGGGGGGRGWGGGGSVEPLNNLKIHFTEILDFINYFDTVFTLILSYPILYIILSYFKKSILLSVNISKWKNEWQTV